MKKCIFLRVLCKTCAIQVENRPVWWKENSLSVWTSYLSFLIGDVVIDAETVWWENCRTLYNRGAVSSQSDCQMSPYTVLVHFLAVTAWLRRETSRLDEDVKTILRLFIFFWTWITVLKNFYFRKNQLHLTKTNTQTNTQTNKNKNTKWNGKMNEIALLELFTSTQSLMEMLFLDCYLLDYISQ